MVSFLTATNSVSPGQINLFEHWFPNLQVDNYKLQLRAPVRVRAHRVASNQDMHDVGLGSSPKAVQIS